MTRTPYADIYDTDALERAAAAQRTEQLAEAAVTATVEQQVQDALLPEAPPLPPGYRPPRPSWRQRRANRRAAAAAREPGPGLRGWPGPGRGENLLVEQPDEFRASSTQLAGWWMFPVGAGTPQIGAPLGLNLITGVSVCCDEIAWFQRAKLISAPTMAVLAKPGLGKSTLIRRKLLMQYRTGVLPLILGDLKPDYPPLIRALGGQVLTLGPGAGALNILDPGEAWDAAKRIAAAAGQAAEAGDDGRARFLYRLRDELLGDMHTRRKDGLSALITISRGEAPTEREESITDAALRVLDAEWSYDTNGAPLIPDLRAVIARAPQECRDAALDRGSMERYLQITEPLEASLVALTSGGRLGDMFSRPTTEPMRRDRPVCFDLHLLRRANPAMKAAALIATWTYGFGAVNAAHALADAGLEPQRLYAVVMDELWDALRVGHGMPGRVDGLMRVNRTEACGVTLCTHSMGDLRALPTEHDREQARSLFEKAGIIICGGSASAEMPMLEEIAGFSQAEQGLLTSWQDPPTWDPVAGVEMAPPGQGNFLVKIGEWPGIPLHLRLTSYELDEINDTSSRWHTPAGAR
jgi:hypothetical protein